MFQNYTKEFAYNLRLSYPVILGMLGHTFVAFADNIMVGQLGTAELAAVSLGNSFVFIAMSLGIGFCLFGAMFASTRRLKIQLKIGMVPFWDQVLQISMALTIFISLVTISLTVFEKIKIFKIRVQK